MKRGIVFVAACILFPFFAMAQPTAIKVYGSLKGVMQEATFQPAVSIDTLKSISPLFGLGVAAGLQGEIIMIDGKCYHSFIDNDQIVTKEERDTKAAMLVVSNQALNRSVNINNLNSMEDIERAIRKISAEHNNAAPMPFLIRSSNAIVNFHVIDWKKEVTHTPSNHKQFAKTGELSKDELIVVGFFSDKHQGIFTPHGTAIHMHVYDPVKQIVGHVDSIKFFDAVDIQIP